MRRIIGDEAIPKVRMQMNVGDCFVAKNAPRNDTCG